MWDKGTRVRENKRTRDQEEPRGQDGSLYSLGAGCVCAAAADVNLRHVAVQKAEVKGGSRFVDAR